MQKKWVQSLQERLHPPIHLSTDLIPRHLKQLHLQQDLGQPIQRLGITPHNCSHTRAKHRRHFTLRIFLQRNARNQFAPLAIKFLQT